MNTIKSMANQNITGDGEEFTKVYKNRRRSPKLLIWTIYLSWNHWTITLHRSETSGIVRLSCTSSKRRASAVLLPSGSDDKWWSDSLECYYYLQDGQDLLADVKSQYERNLVNHSKDMLYSRVGEFGKKIFWLLRSKNWKFWMHQKYIPVDNTKMMKNSYFLWQVIQQKNHGETSNPKNPVWDGNPP